MRWRAVGFAADPVRVLVPVLLGQSRMRVVGVWVSMSRSLGCSERARSADIGGRSRGCRVLRATESRAVISTSSAVAEAVARVAESGGGLWRINGRPCFKFGLLSGRPNGESMVNGRPSIPMGGGHRFRDVPWSKRSLPFLGPSLRPRFRHGSHKKSFLSATAPPRSTF